jgi:hypothetical protein
MIRAFFSIVLMAPVIRASAAPIVTSVTVTGANLPVKLATQVGLPYDSAMVDKDVHSLWEMGRLEDIHVEVSQTDNGTDVVFHAVPVQEVRLHEIRIEPNSFGLHLKLPEGSMLDRRRAQQVAVEAERQLTAQGYLNAHVEYSLAPVPGGAADLRLTVHAGTALRVKEVEIDGDSALPANKLNGALHALRIRRMLPALPHVWGGWRLLPAYSPDAVYDDIGRLESLYLSRGYFDAEVRPGDVEIHGQDARVHLSVKAGPHYSTRNWSLDSLCPCLFAGRRDAERQGVLEFSAELDIHRADPSAGRSPSADLSLGITRGQPFRVARIDFAGNHHYGDAFLRRNLLLGEGEPLNQYLLRKSLDRLNRTARFENLGTAHVSIRENEETGLAYVSVRVKERRPGSWNLSGPVGPVALGGPLQASIAERLPSWGRGLLELSTYSASISLIAFAHPVIPVLGLTSKSTWLPVLALARPFSPGEGWKSGFAVTPQIGARGTGFQYASTQLEQRVLPVLAGDRGLVPGLPVTVHRPAGDATLICQPAKPRFAVLRTAASIALQFLIRI